MSYVSTFDNRLYVGLEAQYAVAAPITSQNRISTVQLQARQAPVPVRRRDKTGSRTFIGLPAGLRTETSFQLLTYMTSWGGVGQPVYGPLFQAAMGGTPQLVTGLTVAQATGAQIQTSSAHGLGVGSGVSFNGEIRFVSNVIDATTFQTNVPFTWLPPAAAQLAPCITYRLGSALPSVTVYDYWQPTDAVSRVITGAAVDQFQFRLNGDFHEFLFSGPASDLLDSVTFSSGSSGLSTFPTEPARASFDYSIVPGHLGQAWLGSTPTQFLSLTSAKVRLTNHLQLRAEEFGASKPLAVVPGPREVEVSFTLLAYDDTATAALYAAGKQRNPVSAMFQLGLQQGRLMGMYVPAVTPEVPSFDNSDVRLQWQFNSCPASGVSDDEFYLAFA